ncbi:MAG: HD domain-containing protein [Cyclobacteriaceae bacterium]|jgi:phosphonate degradation associated HDIG domain protein|nr:HD domain-containing protein [Cyclobacteriaceae bacterium]
MNNINAVVDEIFSLYEKYGHEDYIGEPVSQIEHMSQAAQLAIRDRMDDEIILAAFFHDIGHICVSKQKDNDMGGYGIKSHEKIGADFLRSKGLPERIARLVEGHVEAKRYLTFKNPDYYNNLSEASKKTLEYQGGVMNKEEAEAFENEPLFDDILLMRKWDELAKDMNVPLVDMDFLKDKTLRVLAESIQHSA